MSETTEMPDEIRDTIRHFRTPTPDGRQPGYERAVLWLDDALTRTEDSRAEWERTANAFADDVCGYINEILALRSRLESAEELTALKQGIIEAADTRIRELESQLDSAERERRKVDEWITAQVHRGEGVVVFGLTEDGNVGVWKPESYQPDAKCDGVGDTAFQAIARAHSPTPTQGGTNG